MSHGFSKEPETCQHMQQARREVASMIMVKSSLHRTLRQGCGQGLTERYQMVAYCTNKNIRLPTSRKLILRKSTCQK